MSSVEADAAADDVDTDAAADDVDAAAVDADAAADDVDAAVNPGLSKESKEKCNNGSSS